MRPKQEAARQVGGNASSAGSLKVRNPIGPVAGPGLGYLLSRVSKSEAGSHSSVYFSVLLARGHSPDARARLARRNSPVGGSSLKKQANRHGRYRLIEVFARRLWLVG